MPSKRQHGKRFTHIIRPNSKVYVPLERVYVDCEAHRTPYGYNVEKQTLWFGWACYERQRDGGAGETITEDWLRFETAETFWTWLESKAQPHTRTLIYAHNLGYDAALLQLATMSANSGWQMSEYVPDPHLLWVQFTKDGRTLLFVDTLNYFNCSLRYLGESIGVGKLVMPEGTTDSEQWDAYCKQDVNVLRQAMHAYYELLETEDLGHYQRTAASQAYGAFRHRFMKHDILVVADEKLSSLERKAYHGGRTEVFYDREIVGTTHCLDINAMYPAMMATHLYPTKKVRKGDSLSLDDLQRYLNWGCVIAEVTLTTDEPCYPYDTGSRVIYPIGTFTTTLTTRELHHALYRNRIQSVGSWAVYEDALLFQNFVLTLHRLRHKYKDEGNAAFSYMCKLLMNSLYGKFGQNGRRWLPCSDPPIDGVIEAYGSCSDSAETLLHRLRFDVWQHQLRDSEAFESFPAIAAHITADARMHLWQMITTAGREHVFYCDTDSVYCDEVGMQRLHSYIDARVLGALKHEGTYQSVHFRAPKDYRLESYNKVKGVRSTAWAVRDGYYEQDQFESYDQVLGRGDDGYILVKRIAKSVKRKNLQSVGENVGWRTPISIG